MFVDARTLPDKHIIKTDICIIGAGAAGITLARQFIDHPARICLLDSGGFEQGATQSLAQGLSTGIPYYPLIATRLRYFGGTTNHWGGYCRPFHNLDFEKREWVPYSGWPFPLSALNTYYEDARQICQLPSSDWDIGYWQKRDENPTLPLPDNNILTRPIQIIHPKALRRFGTVYRDEIRKAENITTYLYANVTELETDETGKKVVRVQVACLSGIKFSVSAKLVVLAAGGIENPRLLLLSNKRQPAGLGNQFDLVGRFFMEHPRFGAGYIQPADPTMSVRFYRPHQNDYAFVKGYLSLPEKVQRREQVMDVQVTLEPVYNELYAEGVKAKGIAIYKYLVKKLNKREAPDDLGKHFVNVMADFNDMAPYAKSWRTYFDESYPIERIKLISRVEQAPNPNSRVTLATERDQLGLNKSQLDWQLSTIDIQSARRTLELIGIEFGRAGLGRIRITLNDENTAWPDDTHGTYHHMGTTRMHDDRKQGVVNRDCRVHGVSNLFIAGSSVFPTAGSGTPTMMLITLALRLADHLKEKLQ